MKNSNFILRNRVFLLGLLTSIALAVKELNTTTIDWKVVGYAVLMAALSFVANQWRGKGVTLTGIIGTLAATFVTINETGNFSWYQFAISAIMALLSAVAPPPKPNTYEKDSVIVAATQVPPTNQTEKDKDLPTGVS